MHDLPAEVMLNHFGTKWYQSGTNQACSASRAAARARARVTTFGAVARVIWWPPERLWW